MTIKPGLAASPPGLRRHLGRQHREAKAVMRLRQEALRRLTGKPRIPDDRAAGRGHQRGDGRMRQFPKAMR